MIDPSPGADATVEPRLRPVVARLREIERKCRSLAPRNEEAREMATRLESVVQKLERGPREGTSPPPYAELARELFPVARMFESLGFMSIAREVAHVDRQLSEMDPGAVPPELQPSPSDVAGARRSPPEAGSESDASAAPHDRPKAPRPVLASLILLAVAVVVSLTVILRQPSGRATGDGPSTGTPPADSEVIDHSASPALRLKPRPSPEHALGPRSHLADLVGEARLAQQAGDLDEAISLLSEAGSIDPTATTVLETADVLVAELVRRSDQAADAAEWQRATDLLERARELAVRFERSTRPIDEAAHRQGMLERYLRLKPDDRAGLQAAVGSRVIVLTRGEPFEGRLQAVENDRLRLELGLDVGGDGTLIHVVEVPLATIREVRVPPQ